MEEISLWTKDVLTSTFPRVYLESYLERLQMEYNITKSPFSVVMSDLDNFKSINDKYGHSCGDDMLKYFSSSLRLLLEGDSLTTPTSNPIFRYGGDEFIVVLSGKRSTEAAKIISSVLAALKKRQFIFHGRRFNVTFSAGIASFPKDALNIRELIERADKAMYFSKKKGKGRITEYSKIFLEKVKIIFGKIILIIAFMFSCFLAYFSVKGMFKNFIFVDKIIKIDAKRYGQLKKIYLKNGSVIKGFILNEDEPIEVKIIMGKGEGVIRLYKVDILKIVPAEER